MRILVLSQLVPRVEHGTRAANVVIFELMTALARQPDVHVGFTRVNLDSLVGREEHTCESITRLQEAGVEVLGDLSLPRPAPKRSAWWKLVNPSRTDFYPWANYSQLLQQRVKQFGADAVFVPWDEQLTSVCADLEDVLKFAYYGNPDHKAGTHRVAFDRRHGINRHSWLRSQLYVKRLEQAHLDVMYRYELVGNVAANDAFYYSRKGHSNSFYIRNVWIDRFGPAWQALREHSEPERPIIIVANVGNMNGTANRYGIEMIGRELLPRLQIVLQPGSYEVHLFGAGELLPQLRDALYVPEVKVRGFVPDIDRELLRAHLFVCLNNASPYKVGHTRYLHAWSLGCPVIAHADAALSMPEIVHDQNALLGASIADIAAFIHRAAQDATLRRRIGLAGYQTFKACFTAERVVPDIVARIKHYLQRSRITDSEANS